MSVAMPAIHMNGTSIAELINQNSIACAAVQEAIDALVKAAPNGRDYYPQGQNVIALVMHEHTQRCKKLCAVRDELYQIQNYLLEQLEARETQRAARRS